MTGSRRACLDVATYLIGVWLRADGMAQSSLGNSFALGTLAGFAIFEKLSLFVCYCPLHCFYFKKSPIGTFSAGCCRGLACRSPLLVANLLFLVARGQLIFLTVIFLTDIGTRPTRIWMVRVPPIHLSVGAGENVTRFILGQFNVGSSTRIRALGSKRRNDIGLIRALGYANVPHGSRL